MRGKGEGGFGGFVLSGFSGGELLGGWGLVWGMVLCGPEFNLLMDLWSMDSGSISDLRMVFILGKGI